MVKKTVIFKKKKKVRELEIYLKKNQTELLVWFQKCIQLSKGKEEKKSH